VKTIEGRTITANEIAEILENYQTMPLGMMPDKDNDFRISIAGAQEKTALLFHNGQWMLPKSATPTTHIFKLPIGQAQRIDLSDSVENEWICHKILKAYSLPAADAEIVRIETIKALVVTRFDRKLSADGKWIIRLPQEDMCQALGVPPGFKYESDGGPGITAIMKLLFGSSNQIEDRHNFMKAQLVFWLLAAIDGHAKNFSIFLNPAGRYVLTPLYDVMSAYPVIEKKHLALKKIRMAMGLKGESVNYKWSEIRYRYWLSTAHACGFPPDKMNSIIDETLETMDVVLKECDQYITSDDIARVAIPIFEGMRHARDTIVKTKE
jgi:serine/threonine-protein kinase HipA